jgi:microcystin-dependent protein
MGGENVISTDWFLGEIRAFPYGMCPAGWLPCDGREVPISQYQAFYAVIRNTFGGDGRTTFAMPNLMGKAIVGHNDGQAGDSNLINLDFGKTGGEVSHLLTENEVPSHSHMAQASSMVIGSTDVYDAFWALGDETDKVYAAPSSTVVMDPRAIGNTGEGDSHTNMQPYQPVYFCIACWGLYPTPNDEEA